MNNKNKGSVKWRSPFTLIERSIIEIRWCRDGRNITEIAKEFELHKSSVSREIGGKSRKVPGKHDADRVHEVALKRISKHGNVSKVEKHEPLKTYIEDKLQLGWSPEQISIRLPIEYQDDASMRVATESVYQEVYRRAHRGGNGLLRRFFPKKTNWALVPDEDIAQAEYLINTRLKKRHGGLTPVEVLYQRTGVALYSGM